VIAGNRQGVKRAKAGDISRAITRMISGTRERTFE
jgi:hypothetical protein